VKERLTGAIILVVLIVLLVPELLSGPKGTAVTPPVAGAASPSSEEPPLRSYTINLGDDSHTQSETAGGAAATTGPATPQPSGPAQPTNLAGTADADANANGSAAIDSQAAPAPATAASHTTMPGGPGSPTSQGHRDSPTPQQPASTQRPPAQQQQPSRDQQGSRSVKSTPSAAARSEAAKAGRTASERPSKAHSAAAPGTTTNAESGSWAVQLGVFASRENAERLALEVRVKGFKASVSPVPGSKRKLYRVRVGPTADRSGAQELQGRLKAAGRPGGTVVPYS
jgi:cell division septation protein DedD